MGQCGCGNFNGEFTLPAPNGGLYAFWRYRPCEYCDTPAGIVVCYVPHTEIDSWHANEIPQLILSTASPQALIAVVSPNALAEAAKGHSLESLLDGGEGYKTLSDYLEDEGRSLLEEAVCKTMYAEEWNFDTIDKANLQAKQCSNCVWEHRSSELTAEIKRLRTEIANLRKVTNKKEKSKK